MDDLWISPVFQDLLNGNFVAVANRPEFTMNLRDLLLTIGFLLSFPGWCTIYYLSPSGSDSNNGTSASTPWRSIDRLVQSIWSVQAGDQILFQRGGTYRGQFFIPNSGTASNPIAIGAYGTGADPIISGSVLATGWTQYSGNIWRCAVTGPVSNVFVGGVRQVMARYPNSGWLRNDQGSTTYLYDASLNQSSGYWNGARAIIRSSNWSYEVRTVSSFSNSTLSFPALTFNLGTNDWGYFLENKLTMLDAAGEWYHDAASGQLYLWAPGNANPNNLSVEASVKDRGVTVNYGEQHVSFTNLVFQHQSEAGIWVDGADHVTAGSCTFRDLYHAIRATGDNCVYQGNTILRTSATAIFIYGSDNEVAGNVLLDIAQQPGKGESAWGYFGVQCNGNGNAIRDNTLENIGYSAIFTKNDAVVERNVIKNAVDILNDGGGIHFDNADGMLIQDNIITDLVGDLASSADAETSSSNTSVLVHGIFFGNQSIRNTVVQRNTCARNSTSGILVDHTMVSSGNVIQNNVLFDNGIQLSITDHSNYNGPNATPPYFVPVFNTQYVGNVMYCLNAEQLCMRHYNSYSTTAVDYGTFTNNRYFNPWKELSIEVLFSQGGERRRYSLERWQYQLAKDAGSTRSPLRLDAYATQSVLTGNLVANGTFDQNVTGWWYWPDNGSVSHDMTYLDNGALKTYLPNGNQYPQLFVRSSDLFSVQNAQWYRMRFSVQSNTHGIVSAGVKGNSQLSGGEVIHQRDVPYDGGRRDLEFHFQADMSDQGMLQFVNHFTEYGYWVDNVELHRVTVQAIDPNEGHILLVNDQSSAQSFTLPAGCWFDVLGNAYGSTVTLQPFSSKVAYRVTGPTCSTEPANTIGAKVLLGGAMDAGSNIMRTDLRTLGLIPSNQPYTALGISVSNNGQTIASSVMQATGNDAIVDWIVLELRQNNSSYTVLERRAALVKANGEVIGSDGSTQIPFTTSVQGKYLVVRHRNHLSAMCSTPIATGGTIIDLTSTSQGMFGQEPTQVVNGKRRLWPGDTDRDGAVRYTGAPNDRDPILAAIGGQVPTYTIMGYSGEDINMDGSIKYSGAGNDRDLVLQVIGGAVPTAVRFSQLP